MNDIITIVCSGILLTLIWWFFTSEYKKYRIDLARQRLFVIRDELFDQAKNGSIPFDAKAYGIARSTINGMIRFTHTMSFIRFLTIVLAHKIWGKNEIVEAYNKDIKTELSKLSDESSQVIGDAIMRANIVLVTHIVFTSLTLTIVIYPLILVFKLFNLWNKIIHTASKPISSFTWAAIDAEANYVDREARDKPIPI